MGILLALYGLNRFCLVPLTGSRLLALARGRYSGRCVDAVPCGAFAGTGRMGPPLRRLIPVWTYLFWLRPFSGNM